ncbi:hypothetical protein [Paenisporosarcina sp.]|uniref:hypothetical protein n=1 Tax=Paenisporosarcina sp. TaxID=1932001 RepID=UPI003C70C7A3
MKYLIGGRKMILLTIFSWIVGLFILYIVIFTAVRDAIDKSDVGKILIKKYGVKKEIVTISDEEIEKEFEDDERR